MTEIWKPIKEFEGLYEVSNMGNVRRVGAIPRVLKSTPSTANGGYYIVTLCNKSIRKTKRVHRLVMEAFCGDSSLTVNHIDMNVANNALSNLEYMELVKNIQIAKFKPILQFDKSGNFIREWDGASEVEKEMNISNANISKCCMGKRKTAGGYIWRFKK